MHTAKILINQKCGSRKTDNDPRKFQHGNSFFYKQARNDENKYRGGDHHDGGIDGRCEMKPFQEKRLVDCHTEYSKQKQAEKILSLHFFIYKKRRCPE